MKTFIQPLHNLAEFEEIQKSIKNNKGVLLLTGCTLSQKANMIHGLSDMLRRRLVICEDEKRAKELYEDTRFYDKTVLYYPAKDLLFFQADIHGNLLIRQRMQVILCTEYFCNGVLHGLLHRGETGLPLPAMIGGAVVSETECNVSQIPYLVRMIDPARITAQKARAR